MGRLRNIPVFGWVWIAGVTLVLLASAFHFLSIAGSPIIFSLGWTIIIGMFIWAILIGPPIREEAQDGAGQDRN